MASKMNLIDQYPSAKAFTIKGTDQAVLMIHGFTSTPNIFRELAHRLSESLGWEIHAPLLSGHGLEPTDLDGVQSKDWTHDAEAGLDKLLIHHSKIHLIGLSLGGTLCAYLAQRYSNNIVSVTMLAPAMYVRSFIARCALPLVRIFLPAFIRKKWVIQKKDPDTTEKISYHTYSAQAVIEFDKVCRKIKKSFKANKPCLIFVPSNDQTIHPKSGKWFLKRSPHPKSKIIELETSPHVVLIGNENEKIYNEIENFLKIFI